LDNNYRLVALRPDNANAHFNLSDVLLALRRYDDALAAANDALAIVDKHPGALLNRGVALASMGEIVLAQESLTAAVQVDPSVIDRLNGFLSHPLVASDLDARLIYIHEGLERFETCNWLGWDNFLERLIPILHDASQEGAHFQDRSLLFRVAALPWVFLSAYHTRSVRNHGCGSIDPLQRLGHNELESATLARILAIMREVLTRTRYSLCTTENGLMYTFAHSTPATSLPNGR
jgi:tetratricopeptide (TPR) repeat protein